MLTGFGARTGNPNLDNEQAWNGFKELLVIQPLLLVQAARRGFTELYPGRLNSFLEPLRDRILGLGYYPSPSEISDRLTKTRTKAESEMAVDEFFVTKSLLPDAESLLAGAIDSDHNLRLAIANSQAARKYLAGALIEKIIRGEIS